MVLFGIPGSTGTPMDNVVTSERYSSGFLIQTMLHLNLHYYAANDEATDTVLPPSLPPMDSAASAYDEPFELGSATSSFIWPWLRDGLAGTPLARLSSDTGQAWVGHYTYIVDTFTPDQVDPPMILRLFLATPPVANAVTHKVYFHGEGTDGIGQFTLDGECDTRTGMAMARKLYVNSHWWDWYGVVTPFGMVGVWGNALQTFGLWWIWPQEWCEKRPASAATTVT